MRITVFINEDSLQGQFCGRDHDSIKNLLIVINTLMSNNSVEVTVLASKDIFSKQLCGNPSLTLDQLCKGDRDLANAFKGMLDRGGYWNSAPSQQETSVYKYNQKLVTNTSVAEAREYAEKGKDTILTSFPDTDYSSNSLDVTKDGVSMLVPHALTTDDVIQFLENKGIALKYDRAKSQRVDDKQTVLADATQFSATKFRVQGRTVYLRIDNNQYWYVDNFHRDGSAHLEVFSSSDCKFIGTCDIEDISKFRRASRREIGRKGRLEL